jgi:YD repeat-containing protein
MSASRRSHPYGLRVFHLDPRGRLVGFTDGHGEMVTFAFDGDRRVIRITDPERTVHEVPWEATQEGFVLGAPRTVPATFAVAESLEALRASAAASCCGASQGVRLTYELGTCIGTYVYDANDDWSRVLSPPLAESGDPAAAPSVAAEPRSNVTTVAYHVPPRPSPPPAEPEDRAGKGEA